MADAAPGPSAVCQGCGCGGVLMRSERGCVLDARALVDQQYASARSSGAGWSLPAPYRARAAAGPLTAARARRLRAAAHRAKLRVAERGALPPRVAAAVSTVSGALLELHALLRQAGAAPPLLSCSACGAGRAEAADDDRLGAKRSALQRSEFDWASACGDPKGDGRALVRRVVRNAAAHERLLVFPEGDAYVIPARSRFVLSDFARFDLVTALCSVAPGGHACGFRRIVMDPPWPNKSVDRSGWYSSLPAEALCRLPLARLAHGQGALVAIWLTNDPALLEFVRNQLLREWGCVELALWFWVKVTDSFEPVVPLPAAEDALPQRLPFEPLLLAGVPPRAASAADPQARELPPWLAAVRAAGSRVLCSVPTQHSRKPVVTSVLPSPPVPPASDCAAPSGCWCEPGAPGAGAEGLELFARNLLRGWTSWGNEVLKFQSTSAFCSDRVALTELEVNT